LVYQECKRIARETLEECYTKYMGAEEQGDPNVGQTNTKKLEELEADVKNLKSDNYSLTNQVKQLSNRKGGKGGYHDEDKLERVKKYTRDREEKDQEDRDYDSKKKRTCSDYNSSQGCSKSKDDCDKRHSCNKNLGKGRICWGPHAEKNHK
jgi:hypothetical protein